MFSEVEGRKDAAQSPLCLTKDGGSEGAKERGKGVQTAEIQDVEKR